MDDTLCNPDLYEYASELREAGNHDLLLDLAQKVYGAATARGGVSCDEVVKPTRAMTLDQLHSAIMACCACGIEKMGHAGKVKRYETALRHIAKHAASGAHSGREHVRHIKVTSAPFMARQLIKAQCYEGQPDCKESRLCRQKRISWKMDVDDDRVTVTRSRVGGETHRYSYDCADEKEYQKLVKQTAKTRDYVLKNGHF